MLVLEAKVKCRKEQVVAIEEAIRAALFLRNKAIRHWTDTPKVGRFDLNKMSTQWSKEFGFAGKMHSNARQASAERGWSAIGRFYDNCKSGKPGKKGYPQFKKLGHSIEYKVGGWKLSEDRKRITFTDKTGIGTLKLVGTRDLSQYQIKQIKRVRLVRRADGYYCQFCLDVKRIENHFSTGNQVGIDLGLEYFYTDSNGNTVENPRLLKKSEKALKKSQKRVSSKNKGGANRRKARKRLARRHLRVSRQRRDFAVKTARALVQSNDLVVYEDLKVRNMVKNHHLAKSISDASWSMFTNWLEYFAKVYKVWTVAVPPHYTSQDCSGCGTRVKKTLSTRTHACSSCGLVLHRDHNAAIAILNKGLRTTPGHGEINALGQINRCLGGATPSSKLSG